MADRVRPVDPIVADLIARAGEAGWSLNELGRRAGLSSSHVCELRSGIHGASLYTLRRLAAVFDLEPTLSPRAAP